MSFQRQQQQGFQQQSGQTKTTKTTTTTTTAAVQSGGYSQPQFQQQQHAHNPGDLNCPCCNVRIQGEVSYNMKNYVELQEVKKTVKERVIPTNLSTKAFVPNANTKYCSIPGCTVCQGMFRLKEETDTKVIIHREVSHECDFQCKFCSFNAADARLLQLIQQHHQHMAELKKQNEEQIDVQAQISQRQLQQEEQEYLQQQENVSLSRQLQQQQQMILQQQQQQQQIQQEYDLQQNGYEENGYIDNNNNQYANDQIDAYSAHEESIQH